MLIHIYIGSGGSIMSATTTSTGPSFYHTSPTTTSQEFKVKANKRQLNFLKYLII